MTDIDLGSGKTLPRHNVPKHLTANYDQSVTALHASRASIQKWLDSLVAVQLPLNVSGSIICTAVGQSGRTYDVEPGGALLAELRDINTFTALGATAVPTGTAPANPRVGTVFYDSETSSYMRYDGSSWSPVTLS